MENSDAQYCIKNKAGALICHDYKVQRLEMNGNTIDKNEIESVFLNKKINATYWMISNMMIEYWR